MPVLGDRIVARLMPHPEKARGIDELRAELVGREEELSRLQSCLAEAIAGLLASQTWARALGARGKAKVEARYTWDQVYQRVRRIYEALVP